MGGEIIPFMGAAFEITFRFHSTGFVVDAPDLNREQMKALALSVGFLCSDQGHGAIEALHEEIIMDAKRLDL